MLIQAFEQTYKRTDKQPERQLIQTGIQIARQAELRNYYIDYFILCSIADVRKNIHMHSFTFDFHLRTIHQLVSGKPTFRKGFNLVLFLDDFMMYYNKGPNFARNAIHRGSIEVPCTQVKNISI